MVNFGKPPSKSCTLSLHTLLTTTTALLTHRTALQSHCFLLNLELKVKVVLVAAKSPLPLNKPPDSNMRACLLIAAVLLQCLLIESTAAQKLTGNLTGSGASCIPDAFSAGSGLGVGCGDNEACCPTTSTCVKKTSCSDFARICPPPSCGKDTNFGDTECPAEVSKIFKSPKGLKCQRSSDAACYTNGTAMVVTCTNTAGGVATQMTVVFFAILAWFLGVLIS